MEYEEQREQQEKEIRREVREFHERQLEEALQRWPRLAEMLEKGALVFDADDGVLRGDGLAPIDLQFEEGGRVVLVPGVMDDGGFWYYPRYRRTTDLGEALTLARKSVDVQNGAEEETLVCPLVGGRECLRKDCALWTYSEEVGDGCAFEVMASVMTTLARWGLGWGARND